MMMRQAASVALILLAGNLTRGENLVSGPQVGEEVPGVFRIQFLNGALAGEAHSPVSAKGYTLTALIFASEVSDPLTTLVKRIDKQLEEASVRSPSTKIRGVFVVFPSDDDGLKDGLKDLIAKAGLKQVVFCCGKADGLDKYEISPESRQTVVIFERGKVTANFAFRKDEFSEGWADAIVKALAEVLPKQ